MAIFDLEKDDLERLKETKIEELVARLAEAELSAAGHSAGYVRWTGSISAPDGGIDVHVQVPTNEFKTGFLAKPDMAFQVKKSTMHPSKIKNEMTPKKVLLQSISQQARVGGGYIIVSLKDDCSPQMLEDRIDPNHENIHLDFFDRSKIHQWVRQHPSVMVWVKGLLGQGLSGWRPYGAWTNPQSGSKDELISAPGVSITLPLDQKESKPSIEQSHGVKVGIKEGIDQIRNLIRTTKKAIRIIGLSGVGKTRIVQALFDETVGKDALDRTLAIYVDTGESPDPSAHAILSWLLVEDKPATLIIDNCSAELHSSLTKNLHGRI